MWYMYVSLYSYVKIIYVCILVFFNKNGSNCIYEMMNVIGGYGIYSGM